MTMYKNSYTRKAPYQEREGACFKDIWRFYHSLPENTYFNLMFIDNINGTELQHIAFTKCLCALEPKSIPEYEQEIQEAFRHWGYEEYRALSIIWRRGFGNYVEVRVAVENPNRKEVMQNE